MWAEPHSVPGAAGARQLGNNIGVSQVGPWTVPARYVATVMVGKKLG